MLWTLAFASVLGALGLTPDRGSDFHSFYLSAQEWMRGGSPYGIPSDLPNLTPPFLLVLFAPFARLSFERAYAVWTALSLLLIGACVPSISSGTAVSRRRTCVGLLALSPSAIALALGQVSFVVLALLTAAWSASRRDQRMLAGASLGVLCSIKPFYGLFILWLVWRRDWRGTSCFLAAMAACVALSVFAVGEAECWNWIRAVGRIDWHSHIYNASIHGIGARVFGPPLSVRATMWTPVLVSPVMTLACDVILLSWICAYAAISLFKADRRDDVDFVFAAIPLVGMLMSPLAWVHYLPACAGPVLAVLSRRPRLMYIGPMFLSFLPYQLLVNRGYGVLGTVVIGQWAPGLVTALLWLVLSAEDGCYSAGQILGHVPLAPPKRTLRPTLRSGA